MGGQSKRYAFEVEMVRPIAGFPLYKYTILKLKPTRPLFHGYGGDIREVRDTG
jgi:hypothetical protein